MNFSCSICGKESGSSLVCPECIPHLNDHQRRKTMQAWHRLVIEQAGNACTYCGASFETDSGELCGDHIQQRLTRPDLVFDVSNGRATCLPCHNKRHDGTFSPKLTMKQNKEREAQKKSYKRPQCKADPRCPMIPLDNGKCIQHQKKA